MRTTRSGQVARLPGLLRAIRIAELLYFPVACFLLLGLPVPRLDRMGEVLSYLVIAAEAFAAVAVYIGLGQRRRWALVLAIVLAAWVLTGLARFGRLASVAFEPGNRVLVYSLVLLAWTFVTQLVAISCSLAFIARRGEMA
jgi:hypothetical protein